MDARFASAAAIIAAGFVLVYWRVIAKLASDWWTDDNYSHGVFIVPLACYFAWQQRRRFFAAPLRPSALGLVVVGGSMIVLALGVLGAELFLTRISIIGTCIGVVLFLFGWQRLYVLAFPLAFLILMVPWPAIIFNQVAMPLQLLASRFGEVIIGAAGIPVLREGNVLVLANTTLEVAEACSGIRSLFSLVTLAIVLGYFGDPRPWVRTAIAFAAVPVAVIANGMRVAGTGIAAHYIGPQAAEGFLHEFSGWVLFVVAFVLLLGVLRLLLTIAPKPALAPTLARQEVA
jgi:exosortase